jgi:Xaa-Pro aminopeptidase
MKIDYSSRIKGVRAEMRREKLDGYIVPRIDRYQGEFVPPETERVSWLSGFTGSAGTVIILKDKAIVMTDARYTIQVEQQIDKKIYMTADSMKMPASKWIVENAKEGAVIGYDPWLVTPKQLESIHANLSEKNMTLKPVDNLVDRVWKDKPVYTKQKAEVFPEKVAGASSAKKKEALAKALQDKKAFATIINMPDSLAWLLNVRGHDIEETPVVLSLAIIYADGPIKWFVDEEKITPAVKKHLGNAVEIISLDEIERHVRQLASEAKKAGKPVTLDFLRSPVWFKQTLEDDGASVIDLKDPTILPKAMKTKSEQEAVRAAHITDGVAMVKLLAWLDKEAVKGKLTELSVGDKIEKIRRESKLYKGHSFNSIVGFAANGAIVHYRATKESSKKIKGSGLLLIDSGGQYHYGTTDITRTVAVGKPTEEMKKNYTLVLKGHIAVSKARFPEGTTGAQIDALARAPLWAENLDYAHGTGHGVGCYLAVHEEATSISSRGHEPLKSGMLISNEPGYYKQGAYGIRIENLVLVKEAGKGMLEFETVTLAPYDKKLIKVSMLSTEEKAWLKAYSKRLIKTLEPKLDKKLKAWLVAQARV